jgi:hypothetical protein
MTMRAIRIARAAAALLASALGTQPSLAQADAKPKATNSEPAGMPAPMAEQEPPLPAPSPPRADEQRPRPVFVMKEAPGRARHVDVGPDAGIAIRPAQNDRARYGTAPAFGAHARIEAARFLGIRAYVLRSFHPVAVPYGGLGLTGSDVEQPDIALTLLGLRAEATWVIVPRARLWAGPGIGWGFMKAEGATASGATTLTAGTRNGVVLEPSLGLGGSFDVVKEWFVLAASLSAGLTTTQSGSMFDKKQAIDSSGELTYIGELPKFAASYAALVSAGIIL